MSTFRTSRGTRGQHVIPRYLSAPYRMSPGRREHIYGPVASDERPEPWPLRVLLGATLAICFAVIASGAL